MACKSALSVLASQLRRARHELTPLALSLSRAQNDEITFISSMQAFPDHEKAKDILYAVAAQFKPICKRWGLGVNSLEEHEWNTEFAGACSCCANECGQCSSPMRACCRSQLQRRRDHPARAPPSERQLVRLSSARELLPRSNDHHSMPMEFILRVMAHEVSTDGFVEWP